MTSPLDRDDASARRDYVIDGLAWLAADASVQRGHITELGRAILDELALEFDDGMMIVPGMFEDGEVSAEEFRLLTRLDAMLDAMSEEHELWQDFEALHSPEWANVRREARECLRLMRGSRGESKP